MKMNIRHIAGAFGLILLLACLYFISMRNYLLFHVIVESGSILIAFMVFVVALNTRGFQSNDYLPFIGFVLPFVGVLDFVHTLAYKGMGVFPGYGADLPTQLWIQARYLQSISFAVAPIFLVRKARLKLVLGIYAAVTGLLLLSLFVFDIFPVCYDDKSGLTPFKIYSEYVICLILVISLLLLIRYRGFFKGNMFTYIALSILTNIASELSFTLYVDVFGVANMAGHLLKVLSVFFIYKGLVERGFQEPYTGLFTNLQQSEQDLFLTRSELHRKNKELASFVYAAGHDLRTPLTSAQGYVQLLKRRISGNIGEEDRKMLDIVLSSLAHLSTMIKDLLDYACLGEGSIEKRRIRPESIIDKIAVEKREEVVSLRARIEIREDLPDLYMSETRAYEIFANLISNSLKFGREGVPPVVQIGIAGTGDEAIPETHEMFFVRDNGAGMTAEVRDHAFDMFFTSQIMGSAGTGAGLAIVKRIVENEGGSIRIESEPGEGTTFYLLLPVKRNGDEPSDGSG